MSDVPDPRPHMAWLADRPEHEALTGYDPSGWAASTWVLHAMYENPSLPSDVTHHERRQAAIGNGTIEPLIVGEVNLDETTTVVGNSLGYLVRPGSPWRRLRWSDYAAREGFLLGAGQSVPPCFRWFPSGSWPISIDPPPEGSLDEASLRALLSVLAGHSASGGSTRCFAFYAKVTSGDFDTLMLLDGPLDVIPALMEGERPPRSTPSNFWPDDRAWFVWTDWDLWATKVSGTAALIQGLRNDPELETLDWPPT